MSANSPSSSQSGKKFSIEFFPPRTEVGEEKLGIVHEKLAALNPDFFSVTYGAGGSTREGTKKTVLQFQQAGSSVAPHLSFGGADEAEVLQLLKDYQQAGVSRIVALRGDLPSGAGLSSNHRYASELVSYIREKTGNQFHIEVACYPEIHPESTSYLSDVRYFKQKVDAGADSAITQYFYNPDAYFRFVDFCQTQGINIPIVPGIMPINNFTNLIRFSKGCGAEIPQWLTHRLSAFGDDNESLKSFGIDVVTALCDRLLQEGAPGLHFYSMNLSSSVTEIWNNLQLSQKK